MENGLYHPLLTSPLLLKICRVFAGGGVIEL